MSSSTPKRDQAWLDGIAARWLAGRLSDQEIEELNAALRDSPEFRQRFANWLRLEDALRTQSFGAATPASSQAAVASARGWRMAYAIAVGLACIGVFTAYWYGGHVRDLQQQVAAEAADQEILAPAGCAVLLAAQDAHATDHTRLVAGDTLLAGPLELAEGEIRLAFYSGVTMTVSAPANLELLSSREARLVNGAVRVRVAPAGRGFILHTPGQRLVDLGTEFGVSVSPNGDTSQLYVFEGEVEMHQQQTLGAEPQLVTGGQGRRWSPLAVPESSAPGVDSFPSLNPRSDAAQEEERRRMEAWQSSLERRADDPRLLGLYRFQPGEGGVVPNLAAAADRDAYGLQVGASNASSRAGSEGALEFKRPGDRVRVLINGEYDALTFACWARIDSLDRLYNALYLTDHYDRNGEPHWQIKRDGTLMFSVRGVLPNQRRRNTILYSEPFFSIDKAGRWYHLAVTFDLGSRQVRQYVNGELAGSGVVPRDVHLEKLVYGPGEFGNWGVADSPDNCPVRNLNGRIDEFSIYREPLSTDEIKELYNEGKQL